jgi:thiol:disulfide interchange protein DsbC
MKRRTVMATMPRNTLRVLTSVFCAIALHAAAQEAVIRKTLSENMPQLPKIDEVKASPIPGLYELRIGNDIVYSDARGEHLFNGSILETRTQQNLTQQRIGDLTKVAFDTLPLKDAIVWRQGTGERKMVVFADPNCGYCKKFESDMQRVRDVTVYTFLFPILGGDSPTKARDLWCAKDKGAAWRNWMIRGEVPPHSIGPCDAAALERNVAMGRRLRLTGTPSIVFEDGRRLSGAMSATNVEQSLSQSHPPG